MRVYCYNLKVKNIRQQSTLHEGHWGNVMITKFSLSHCLLPKVTASLKHHEINKTIIIIKAKVKVTQSTLCNPMDWLSLSMGIPGKNTGVGSHSLFQGNLLAQRSNLCVSCIAGRFFTIWATREAQLLSKWKWIYSFSVLNENYNKENWLKNRFYHSKDTFIIYCK